MIPLRVPAKVGRLNRTLLALFPILLLVANSAICAEQNQLDGNETLFTVLAAINAAGYDADLASATNNPLRQAVRDYIIKTNPPSLEELKRFFAAHKQKNNGAELSQYVSYSLLVTGPPAFEYKLKPSELPPDVVPMEGLGELLSRFYKEANIAAIWKQSQPAIDQVLAAYQPPVTQSIMQVNAYLRNPTSGYLGRHFQVYVDLLGAPNQIHTRSYRDDYYIVVTSSVDPQVDEVRHGYLHYLLDPLVLKHAEELSKKRSLFDFAQGIEALDQSYKDDYSLLVTECLIKAIEARLTPGAAKKQAAVDLATREGFIFTPAFADALPIYEKQDLAMRFYFKEVVASIDLRNETRRLDKVQFAHERTAKVAKSIEPPPPAPLTGVAKSLIDADDLYRARKLDEARDAYLKILKQKDEQAAHAKAYYGLARIATLQRDGELAERMFQKTLDMSPDGETRAWSLVYLGRLADAQGQRDNATKHYQAALQVKDATNGARQAAEQGLKQSFAGQK